MGGGLALQCLTAPLASALAGIFSISAFVPAASAVYTPPATAAADSTATDVPLQQRPPLFVAHGRQDGIIPVEWGRATVSGLRMAGYAVHYEEFMGLAHDMSWGALFSLEQWIPQCIGVGAGSSHDYNIFETPPDNSHTASGFLPDFQTAASLAAAATPFRLKHMTVPYAIKRTGDKCRWSFL